jgi:tetratricopeptide (TPR) repeat protein
MSEMLGNQYFIARNYPAAEIELEKCLEKYPESKPLRRKLIVCFTQTGKVKRALDMFTELIQEDIGFVTNADVEHDDCPCPEIVEEFEEKSTVGEYNLDNKIMLGILWLYCDTEKSLDYFRFADNKNPGNEKIQSCIRLIEKYIKTQKSKTEISP